MAHLVLHPKVEQQIELLSKTRPHAVLLEAGVGSGKQAVALHLAATITGVAEPLKALQQVLLITRGDDKSVSIDKVRTIEQFLSRKLPGDSPRIVIIDEAHTLTPEAQNALLKTLEEPPANTMLILAVANPTTLLSTVRSRAISVPLIPPTATQLETYFTEQGIKLPAIRQAHLMSGGRPGLMSALLLGDEQHPLLEVVSITRQVVQATTFERLVIADQLSKQRDTAIAVCGLLQQMAHVTLANGPAKESWQRLLSESYRASEQLQRNGQPKLVLTNLMLNL